VQQNTDFL